MSGVNSENIGCKTTSDVSMETAEKYLKDVAKVNTGKLVLLVPTIGYDSAGGSLAYN